MRTWPNRCPRTLVELLLWWVNDWVVDVKSVDYISFICVFYYYRRCKLRVWQQGSEEIARALGHYASRGEIFSFSQTYCRYVRIMCECVSIGVRVHVICVYTTLCVRGRSLCIIIIYIDLINHCDCVPAVWDGTPWYGDIEVVQLSLFYYV